MSHELVLHLCFFSSMNWQGHEVWIQVLLLVLMGQQGAGEGRPGGAEPPSVASPTPGFGGRSTPSPREGYC